MVTDEILSKASVKGIAQYLLYGEMPEGWERESYDCRLSHVLQECEDVLTKYNKDKESDLYQAIYNLIGEYEEVYTELGVRAGIMLIKDAFSQDPVNNDTEKKQKEVNYKGMYEVLLEGITQALAVLSEKNEDVLEKTSNILKAAQSRAEDISDKESIEKG